MLLLAGCWVIHAKSDRVVISRGCEVPECAKSELSLLLIVRRPLWLANRSRYSASSSARWPSSA